MPKGNPSGYKDPNYLKLDWKTRMKFDQESEKGDPTKKKKKNSKTVDYFTEDNNGPV